MVPVHRRLRVAVLYGGRSGEHDVSIVSARSVLSAVDQERYQVLPMAIGRNGLWADADTAWTTLEGSGDHVEAVVHFEGRHQLDPRLTSGEVDVVFPVLHGPFGEDGSIQGLLEVLGLPYVGCDHYASATCMDKGLTKRLLAQGGLATPGWAEITAWGWGGEAQALRARCLELGLPLFVKPARLGSSVGISKVNAAKGLDAAVELALGHDERVVVERGLDAREIEIAVLGNTRPRASVPGEVVPGHEFYDYDDKYVDDACQLLAPAPLEPAQAEAARTLAVRAFRLLGCEGMARVDLFLEHGSGAFWVNEINTIPGFTSISMYPRLWDLTGIPYPKLIDELIRLALQRHERRGQFGVEGSKRRRVQK